MMSFLTSADARILAIVLALLMCGGWWLGCWRTRFIRKQDEDHATDQLTNASVALLGLLLAFTFSLSLDRFDQRRQMMIQHANTIGDFSTCADMQNEPVRGQLRKLLQKYVTHLLAIHQSNSPEKEMQRVLTTNDQMHNEMQSLVKNAVDGGTPIAISLVNTFNDVTSSHNTRLAAFRNRLPPSIIILLSLSAIISMIQIGMQHGRLDERELTMGASFVLLVSMCVWVTLDLNQLHGGVISVSQEPLQRLLANLGP